MADSHEESKPNKESSTTSRKVLFVRNLPFSTTENDLENLFSEVGPVKRCFVIRNKGESSLCRGFGYVTFALSEDAEKAKDTLKTYKGRQLSICFADKKPRHEKRKLKHGEETAVDDNADNPDGQNNDAKEMQSDEDEPPKKKSKGKGHDDKSKTKRKEASSDVGRTIVMTGVATEVNRNHIRKKCRKIGPVEKVTFPVEGREEPTAYVVFESYKDSREALKKLNGKIFKGRTINVCLLSREGKIPSQKSLKKSRVIVRNLAFKCKDADLRKRFSQFGQITDACIPTKMRGNRKQSCGFGFVQFANVFEAAKAVKEMNMKEVLGRPVAVDWAVSKTSYEKANDSRGNLQAEKVEPEDGLIDVNLDDDKENSENESDAESVREKSSISSSDSEGEEDGEDGEDGEDVDDVTNMEDEQKKVSQPRKAKHPSDVKEGKTLFIRNLSFESSEESLYELFETYGSIEYCRVLEDKRTGRSRGMAFVKFKTVESAEQCFAEASKEGSGLSLHNFNLKVSMAVTPGKAKELTKEKKTQDGGKQGVVDRRNLYLAKEGLVLPGSVAAQGLSKADLLKRQKAEAEKKAKLDNPNIFVSRTRLCVRNLPLKVDEKQFKQIFSTATGKKTHVLKALIMRNKERLDSSGLGRSMGFGFVEFTNHKEALAVLRATNNNPALFGPDRRPIVEFSLENSLALKAKQRRLKRSHVSERQGASERLPDDRPKTNKEKRVEKKLKRREKRQRKRQEKKGAKLGQVDTKDSNTNAEDSKKTEEPNKATFGDKERRKETLLKENKRQFDANQHAKERSEGGQYSSERERRKKNSQKSSENKSWHSAKKAQNVNKDTTKERKKFPFGAESIQKGVTSKGLSKDLTTASTNRKRKGTRRKEQERKDESDFTVMVAKYKKKLFGTGDDGFASKRARWFE